MSRLAIGDEVTWTRPDGTKVKGRVEAMRASDTTMYTKSGDFLGIQYRIDGEWTPTFPDKDRPASPPKEEAP